MRAYLVVFSCWLGGCVDLDTICPYKPVTQGVFGQVLGSTNANEEGVEIDIFTMLNGQKDMMIGNSSTNRAGYQYMVLPSSYIVCAKSVCATVMVPEGVVELSAVDGATLAWNPQVAVPPAQMIGACTWD